MNRELISVLKRDLNLVNMAELLNYSIEVDENLQDYVDIKRVNNGDKVGYIDFTNEIGKVGSGCNPRFDGIKKKIDSRVWELRDWEAPLKICYRDIEGTVLDYCLRNGSRIADMTGTEFMTDILLPEIDKGLKRMFWRIAWFGNCTIDWLTDPSNSSLVNEIAICNGFWARIFMQCTKDETQYTEIEANKKGTLKEQKAEMFKPGVATDLFDKILMDSNTNVSNDPNAMIYVTRALGDALAWDIKKTYGSIMPWERVFDGVDVTMYNGVKIAKVSSWDYLISTYDSGLKPFRAVYANKKEFMIGCPSGNLVNDANVWYEPKDRMVYIDIQGKIGTNLLDDNWFHASY